MKKIKVCHTAPYHLLDSVTQWLLCAILLNIMLVAQAFAAIDVNKSFSPATVYPSQTSRLTILLLNTSLTPSTNASFTDIFPNKVFIAATPNATSTCGGTVTHSNNANRGQISLTGGTIPAGNGTTSGSCKIEVNTYGSAKGTYINDIPAGAVTAVTAGVSGSNAQSTQGTLAVILQDITGQMKFVTLTGTFPLSHLEIQGNEKAIQVITLTNPNPTPLTGVTFENNNRNGAFNIRQLTVESNTCAGTLSITSEPAVVPAEFGATSRLNLTGGVIPASSSCEVRVRVESTRDPTRLPYGETKDSFIAQNSIVTTEGTTNSSQFFATAHTQAGLAVTPQFDFSSNRFVNIYNTTTSTLRLTFTNYNVTPITNSNLTSTLPTGLTVTAITGNTCSGSVTTNGTNIQLTNGTIPAAPANQSSIQTSECQITATVSFSAVGTYTYRTPNEPLNPGVLGGHQFAPRIATLTVSGRILDIEKNFSNSSPYQGDANNIVIKITNASTSITVNNINLLDDLTKIAGCPNPTDCLSGSRPYPYFRIGTGSMVNTCGGTLNAPANGTQIQLTNGTVAPAGSCQLIIPIKNSADAQSIGWNYSNIPVGNITYSTPGNPGQVYPIVPQASFLMYQGARILKYFTPKVIGPLGKSRLEIRVQRHASDFYATTNINLTDNLPDGIQVADQPNLVNGCGGTVNAPPGATSISLTNGSMPISQSTTTICSIYINVKAPALIPPAVLKTGTNIIPANVHGSPVSFSAKDASQPAPYNQLELLSSAVDDLTWKLTHVTTNKEFLTTSINGGGVSRVRITLSNTETTSINLTGVGLTDSFTGTDLRLATNVNPTFTNTAGVPNAGGCGGGLFSGTAGSTAITLSGASIAANAVCRFEFNVTAYKGGNHINTLAAGDLISFEGITNPAAVAATLSVGRQINLGIGFSPNTIALGEQSQLTMDIINTKVLPNNETGGNPAVINTLPSGVTVVGTPTTTCAGGVVSTGVTGGLHYIRLNGGTFPAEGVCKVMAQVTTNAKGVFTNTLAAGSLTTLSGAENPDTASTTLRVITKPTITKTFYYPKSIAPGGSRRIVFTIRNPNTAAELPTGLTGVSFSDVLTNMSIAAPLFVSDEANCGSYTHNAVMGGTNFTASNIAIAPSGQCDIYLDVTSTVLGVHPNQTSGVSSSQMAGPGDPSNIDNLHVIMPATVTKSFNPAIVAVGMPTQLTLTLTNPNAALVTINKLTDIFPSSPGRMVIASPTDVSTTCSGTVIRNLTDSAFPAAGDPGILVRNGAIPANSSCTVQVMVTASAVGTYVNTTSNLQTNGGIGAPATAQLVVLANPPIPATIDKSFNPSTVNAGVATQLTFTLTNPNSFALPINSPGFTDTFPSSPGQMVVASPTGVSNTCGSTVRNLTDSAAPAAGDTGILVKGGSIPANSTCTVQVMVTAPVAGKYTNTTSSLSTQGGIGAPASDDLLVINPAKDYGDAPASYGIPSHTTVTGVYLGATPPDTESSALPSVGADGDDTNGVDDEDGVSIVKITQGQRLIQTDPSDTPALMAANAAGDSALVVTQGAPITFEVIVHGTGGYLQGFADWNGDGDVADTGEQIATNIQDNLVGDSYNTVGTIRFTTTVPKTITSTTSYARFRWSTQMGLGATGAANDGEVEDYLLSINAVPMFTSYNGSDEATITLAENQVGVGTLTATHLGNQTLQYLISGGADAAAFKIDPVTGVLQFVTPPDYDNPSDADGNNIYDVQVMVLDENENEDTQELHISITDVAEALSVKVRGFLQGAYDINTKLMRDNLRTLNYLPSQQPYTAAPFNYAGTESVSSTILQVSGDKAVVDWVLVELRDATQPLTIVARKAALLTRNGDVIDAATGSTNLGLIGVAPDYYWLSLTHRNHLAVMTAAPINLAGQVKLVDFTASITPTYGTHARTQVGTYSLLWTGDVDSNNQVISSGPNNDLTFITNQILVAPGNTAGGTNYILMGYYNSDVNLDGRTLYAGPGNDSNIVIGNVLSHPANTDLTTNFILNGSVR